MKLSTSDLVQMRLAHLSMIQAVVGRLSLVSGTLKGFCVTVVAAVLALQPSSLAVRLPLTLAIIAAMALTDAAYLGMERQFRRLYDNVRARDLSEAHDMSIRRPGGYASSYAEAAKSWAVVWFYLPLGVMAAVLGIFAR
jgi:hypothetical protein